MTNASTDAERPPRATTAVVVMGDFGRSPRMQYHALSLADDADRDVVVVSTRGTTPIREIVEHEGVRRVEVTTGEWSMTANWPTALALIARAAGAVRAFVIRAFDDATAPERGVDTESTVYTDVFRVWIGV